MRTSCDVSFHEQFKFHRYLSRGTYFFNFWRTPILFVGPLTPLFRTSGDVCIGFQSQGGSSRMHVLAPTRNKFLRFTSCATTADLLAVGMVAEPFHPRS